MEVHRSGASFSTLAIWIILDNLASKWGIDVERRILGFGLWKKFVVLGFWLIEILA